MTTRQLLGLLLIAIGKRVVLCGMKLADVAAIVMVRRPADAVTTRDGWTSQRWGHADQDMPPVNTVPPRESN